MEIDITQILYEIFYIENIYSVHVNNTICQKYFIINNMLLLLFFFLYTLSHDKNTFPHSKTNRTRTRETTLICTHLPVRTRVTHKAGM